VAGPGRLLVAGDGGTSSTVLQRYFLREPRRSVMDSRRIRFLPFFPKCPRPNFANVKWPCGLLFWPSPAASTPQPSWRPSVAGTSPVPRWPLHRRGSRPRPPTTASSRGTPGQLAPAASRTRATCSTEYRNRTLCPTTRSYPATSPTAT